MRRGLALAAIATLLPWPSVAMLGATAAQAASVSQASFTGGAGTRVVDGNLYAAPEAALALNVTTDNGTQCVEITGAHTVSKIGAAGTTQWTFALAANKTSGIHTITATSYAKSNPNGKCVADKGEHLGAKTASYFVETDATAPVVTGAVSPAANAAGWHKDPVGITWSATDFGSGVAPNYPAPATDSVTAETPLGGVVKTSTAKDNAGNTGTGSVTVRLDRTKPAVTASAHPAANGAGWHNGDVTVSFSATDALSGIDKQPAAVKLGEGASQSASGTAVDLAGNEATARLTGVNVDKTAPTLSAAAATPNAAGWHNGPVTVRWTAADALSGLSAAPPADTVIATEGADHVVTKSVADRAGNSTSASSPKISIDTTAPTTGATAPTGWKNTGQTVTLDANDGLSGVASTHYKLDGAAAKTGGSVAIAGDGTHTVEYWSVDNAGNEESHKTVEVKVDGSSPTITHTLSPAANAAGWHKSDVTVSFVCKDAMSGVASCTADQVVAEEGRGKVVTGTATDNAGNSVSGDAIVNLDETAPSVKGAADRAANGNGWHNDAVIVSFSARDALSGIDTSSAPTTLGEGENQSVTGTATDIAGNATSDTVTGINIDKTAPSLSGAATTEPNATGWHNGDVTVAWTASDSLSGLTASPANETLTGEGDVLSASATVTDKAGNATTKTVGGIRIDRTAPTTTLDAAKAPESGWYTGEVSVALKAADGLSGVDKTYYRVGDGAPQQYDGAFTHGLTGKHTIAFWSVDRAGNTEQATSVEVRIDGVKPTISGSRTPANGFGWNNSDVVVSFACADAHSGIAGCSPASTTLTNEGAGQSVDGEALDIAGNKATATVSDINIDKTAPMLSSAATTAANAAGWYKGDVTVKWTAQDGRSGIDPATAPKDSVITGEGDSLSTEQVTVSDKAGNATGASKSGFKIDRTAPTVDGKPTTAPNADGWYSGPVTVAFACTDALSGIARCSDNKVIATDGKDQSVSSDVAEDLAGNVSATKTVGGINIDGAAPQTTAEESCTKVNGYCKGAKANIVLTAADELSGVKEVRYSVNGGAEQSVSGSVANAELTLNRSGKATVTYYAVDTAGNAETRNAITVKYDNLAPTVTHTLTPAPNAADWNNSDVTVNFSATDEEEGSGVDAARTTPDQTITTETGGRQVAGEAYDVAGNRGVDSVTVKLDKTAPAITGAIVSGVKGADGWHTGEVTVRYTCSDALSSVAVCPKDEVVNTNGANQSVSGVAVDVAGNEAKATVSGISIDREKPAIAFSDIQASYTLGAAPSPACTATDTVSGPASCDVKVTGGTANGVGTFVATATATDKAGNVATDSRTFKVLYKWDGFRQPINDTAHQIGTSTSVFKAASTVPVKFQLKRADGSVVQTTTAPAWIVPQKGGLTSAPVDETPYSDPATSGATYRYDATSAQYIYNWGTTKSQAGSYHRIGVSLDDGQTYSVNIGLR